MSEINDFKIPDFLSEEAQHQRKTQQLDAQAADRLKREQLRSAERAQKLAEAEAKKSLGKKALALAGAIAAAAGVLSSSIHRDKQLTEAYDQHLAEQTQDQIEYQSEKDADYQAQLDERDKFLESLESSETQKADLDTLETVISPDESQND